MLVGSTRPLKEKKDLSTFKLAYMSLAAEIFEHLSQKVFLKNFIPIIIITILIFQN